MMYLIKGNENYFIDSKIEEIKLELAKKNKSLKVISFFEHANFEDIIVAISNIDIFSTNKLIIFKNMDFLNEKTKINKNTKEEAKLVAYDSNYNKIEDIHIEPSSTVMTIEVKNIDKEVPVTVNTIGALPEGYELVSITPEAIKATVRGESQTELDKLTEMLVDVDLSDVKDETEERSNLKLYPKEDIRVTSDPAIVKVTIKVRKK